MPYPMCLVAFLPMIFYASVNTLGCDNGPCANSSASVGFRSVGEYMFSQTAGWLITIFLTLPLSYPLLLRTTRLTRSLADGLFQVVLAIFGGGVAYTYSFFCGGIMWASLFCLVQSLGKFSRFFASYFLTIRAKGSSPRHFLASLHAPHLHISRLFASSSSTCRWHCMAQFPHLVTSSALAHSLHLRIISVSFFISQGAGLDQRTTTKVTRHREKRILHFERSPPP